MWRLTEIKNAKGKVSCSSLFYVIPPRPNVRSFFLHLFSFCRENYFTEVLWNYVSKVARRPLSKENYITFVLKGYWEKLSLRFLNGEHRPYRVMAGLNPPLQQIERDDPKPIQTPCCIKLSIQNHHLVPPPHFQSVAVQGCMMLILTDYSLKREQKFVCRSKQWNQELRSDTYTMVMLN